MTARSGWLAAGVATLALVLGLGLERPAKTSGRPRLVVVGIDGGEWKVIRRLWLQGRLSNLRSLADRGATATLRTAYNSSPVIWTTVATGVVPEVHGITGFVVPTPQGDVPVSSTVRKVPALWGMTTRTGRRAAVLGWWGSWPAEEIDGVVVSDRALFDVPSRVSPASYLPTFEADLAAADRKPGLFSPTDREERRDRVMVRTAEKLVREGYDLVLLYFRSPDLISHHYWKHFEPEGFPGADPGELAAHANEIPRIYEAVDRALGRIVAAAGDQANVVVLSDHGFRAAKSEEVKVAFDLDLVLERLGHLERKRDGTTDCTRSTVYTYASPHFQRFKRLRLCAGRSRDEVFASLAEDLATVTNPAGEPVLTVRPARPRRGETGDFVAVLAVDRVTRRTLLVKGRPFAGAVKSISRLSGTHYRDSHGIFLAAGPDIDPAADLTGIHIHDVAPTLLYGLGLPVGEDFAGQARVELYSAEFRRGRPLRTIPTWGAAQAGDASRSEHDEELLDQLRALGYIR